MSLVRPRSLAIGVLILVLVQIIVTGQAYGATSIVTVATDAASGFKSLSTEGGQKLFQDSSGRMIAVYIDSSGRVGVTWANSSPTVQSSWATPVKSPSPSSAYARPAAVLVSLTSLRVIVEGGAGSGQITDLPVTIQRDSQSNIAGLAYGSPTTLDGSGDAGYPTAVLAQNGNVLAAWNVASSSSSKIKSLRWNSGTGWTNFKGTSTTPDDAVVDTSNKSEMFPAMVLRQDNYNVYVFSNRPSGTGMVFNKATFDGTNWSWGSQKLSYESNASRGLEDSTSVAWDPVKKYVVVAYDVSGTNHYGVFTLDSSDKKTHVDTPSLSVSDNDGGTLEVDATTGQYYLFILDATTDGAKGRVVYTTYNKSWSSLTVVDSDKSNLGMNAKRLGTSDAIDLIYTKEKSPISVRFVRISSGQPPPTPNPTSISITSSPNPADESQQVTISGALRDATTNSGLSGKPVNVQESLDQSAWSLISQTTTGSGGAYQVTTTFTSGTYYLRAIFPGDSSYSTSTSSTVTETVQPSSSTIPTSLSIQSSPNPAADNQPVSISGLLSDNTTGNGVANEPVTIQKSLNQASWSTLAQITTANDGSYSTSVTFIAGTYYLRSSFQGDTVYSASTSTIITQTVQSSSTQPYAVVVADDGNVFRYDSASLTLIGNPNGLNLRDVAWRPDGSYALIVGHGATVLKFDGTTFTPVNTGVSSSVNFQSVAWKLDGSYALISGSSGTLVKFDGVSTSVISTPATTTLRSISWKPDGSSALIVGSGGVVLTYQNGVVQSVSSGTTNDLYATAWSPNGGYALISGDLGTILMYDGANVARVDTSGVSISTRNVRAVAFGSAGVAVLVGDSGLALTYDGLVLSRLQYNGSNDLTSSNLYGVAWLGTTATIVGGSGNMFAYNGTVSKISSGTTSSLRGIEWQPS